MHSGSLVRFFFSCATQIWLKFHIHCLSYLWSGRRRRKGSLILIAKWYGMEWNRGAERKSSYFLYTWFAQIIAENEFNFFLFFVLWSLKCTNKKNKKRLSFTKILEFPLQAQAPPHHRIANTMKVWVLFLVVVYFVLLVPDILPS